MATLPVFNTYDRRARLWPVYLVLMPLALGIASWVPVSLEVVGTLAAVAATFGISMFLTQIARDMGKRKETMLFTIWGGKPTPAALSYRNSTLSVHTLKRYHQCLRKLLPKLKIPASRDAELKDTAAADAVYESCGDYLREQTRDQSKYRLLFEENVNYGYRRNLWGMKPLGIATAAIGLVATGLRVGTWLYQAKELHTTASLSFVFCAALLVGWIVHITPSWVRLASDAYASRLLAACETFEVCVEAESA